jgi:hypothetical protein
MGFFAFLIFKCKGIIMVKLNFLFVCVAFLASDVLASLNSTDFSVEQPQPKGKLGDIAGAFLKGVSQAALVGGAIRR